MIVHKDNLYILTDIEVIVFDVVKSKPRSFSFNLPIYESIVKIEDKEDQYYEMITAIYKEKRVKTEIEPIFKIINSNKYKIDENVYSFKKEMNLDNSNEYAVIFKNLLFIYDLNSKNVLKIFKIPGDKLYFSDGYLFSLKNSGFDIYKYRKNKLRRLFRREIECEKQPMSVYFHNDILYYQIDDKVYKTSIVLKRLEILSGVKFIKNGVAFDEKGAYSVVTSKYLAEADLSDEKVFENGVIETEGKILKG
ncbi:hypothetical protein NBO_33g0017 [Nosema bombycis CQ1]|uniref:Uncharacterized protein n=1 Tax=Nosema bombycis (strain CQ1 / CVCC 102059) TaxID=578461 RepID=R0KTR5_NOSB1|nr:hypothetical protein NBO_33g0017 [Nosema bombycis CQ1]|eukprot:EOB14211.1 hypothetical protein NBO_33g0017 [Nosema bombycis CQ1]